MTIEKYVDGWRCTAAMFSRSGTWLPILILAGIKAVFLAAIYFFWHPMLSGLMEPALRTVFGVKAVHFPEHVLGLGSRYGKVDFVVTVTIGFPFIGWSLIRMIGVLRGDAARARSVAAGVMRNSCGLFVLLACLAAGSKGVPMLVAYVNESIASPRLQVLIAVLGVAVSVIIMGMLLYGPVFFVGGEAPFSAAWTRSVRAARQANWLTGMIVVTGWVIQAPFVYVASNSGSFLWMNGGEFVFVVLLAGVFAEAMTLFYMLSSATLLVSGSAVQGHDQV